MKRKFQIFTPLVVCCVLFGLLACQAERAPLFSSNPAAVLPPGVGARPAGSSVPAPNASGLFATVDQLAEAIIPARDLRDLTVRLRPGVKEVPLMVNEHTPDYQVGDQERFWVHELGSGANREITAELVHKTDVAYAWVEQGQLPDRSRLVEAVDRFSTQSYPAAVAFFGQEWTPGVDNDPRLHILHVRNTGVAGYYSSADQYSRLANPFSNEKELFYIDLTMLTSGNTRSYETVLAHEFQHMIHWHNDINETTWINEGMSEFAQEVTGFGADTAFVGSFIAQPDTQLNSWNVSTSNNANHYGASYLFIHYLNQRFGPDLLQALVAQPADGITGVQQALTQQGQIVEFDTIFADWVVANYAEQPASLGLDKVYGYAELDFRKPVVEQTFTVYPIEPYVSTVYNYATDYLLLAGAGDLTMRFQGQTETRSAPTQPASGQLAWWSNSADMSDSRLTRQFDLAALAPGSPVALQVAMWWSIEPGYDHGYVLASRDGKKWTPLVGRYTQTAELAGNSFGPSYSGQSEPTSDGLPQWVNEAFDLSAYAGAPVWLRFEYISDDAITGPGWLIDDLRIPAIGYASDFEAGMEEWQAEGWLLTDNRLPQRWLVQVLEFADNELAAVQRFLVDESGQAEITVAGLGGDRQAVLAISALAPVTTQPAEYVIEIGATGNN